MPIIYSNGLIRPPMKLLVGTCFWGVALEAGLKGGLEFVSARFFQNLAYSG